MKLGSVSAILPELSLDALLAFAAETGFDSVEVMYRPVERAARRYAGVTHIDAAAPIVHVVTNAHNAYVVH